MSSASNGRIHRVLLLEDEPDEQDRVRRELQGAGFEVLTADTVAAALRMHARGRTDLILLEPALHAEDGIDLCRQLRGSGDDTPIIILSRRCGEVDRIVGLEMGADDVLGKPIHPRELVARVRAVLRRRPTPEPPGAPAREAEVIRFGPFAFDLQRRELRKAGQALSLTTGEYAMLKALARHPGRPLTREQLALLARGRSFSPFDRSLDVQISRLRRVLEEDPAHPRYIQTVWGVGYVFVADGAPAEPAPPPTPMAEVNPQAARSAQR